MGIQESVQWKRTLDQERDKTQRQAAETFRKVIHLMETEPLEEMVNAVLEAREGHHASVLAKTIMYVNAQVWLAEVNSQLRRLEIARNSRFPGVDWDV